MTIFREMKRLGNMQLSHLHGCALLLSSLSFNCLVKHNSALPSISFAVPSVRVSSTAPTAGGPTKFHFSGKKIEGQSRREGGGWEQNQLST